MRATEMEFFRNWLNPSNTTLNRTDINVIIRRIDDTIQDYNTRKVQAEKIISRQQSDIDWFNKELSDLRKQKDALSKV